MPRGSTVPSEISFRVASLMASLQAQSGLTRDALGDLSGIAEGRVSALLNGKKAWYLEDVERLCHAMGLDEWRVLMMAETKTIASGRDFNALQRSVPANVLPMKPPKPTVSAPRKTRVRLADVASDDPPPRPRKSRKKI